MSTEKYSSYIDRIEKAVSEIACRELLLQAARDKDLTTPEFIRLDNWAKRFINDKKGRK